MNLPTASRFARTARMGLLLALGACSQDSQTEESCESVCKAVADCEGSSCMAQCVALESACTETGESPAFAEWASCRPTLACVGGSFMPVTCPTENAAIMACGTTSLTLNLPPAHQAGGASHACASKAGDTSASCPD